MKKNSLRLLLAGLLSASALVAWAPIAGASEVRDASWASNSADAQLGKDLRDCITQKRRISVVFLVDESKSLVGNSKRPGNDPFGLRVLPMEGFVKSLVSYNEDQVDKIEMTAAIFGFGA